MSRTAPFLLFIIPRSMLRSPTLQSQRSLSPSSHSPDCELHEHKTGVVEEILQLPSFD
ncbi:hypothetical protein Syun_001612 [Stephania yunnanensis]|uniref:Uncharacterized protein n=1 Tax=Stephania yunnanensis TaxID=152371 RepID=A0AAP0LG11_9MAGN